MSNPNKVDKILECYRALKEEGMGAGAAGAGGSYAQHANLVSNERIAGLPPDEPPVDLRKRKARKLNMFYRQAVKQSRGASNGRKGN